MKKESSEDDNDFSIGNTHVIEKIIQNFSLTLHYIFVTWDYKQKTICRPLKNAFIDIYEILKYVLLLWLL